MAAYLAELSGTHLAALLLSAGTAPDPQVSQLTRATAAAGLPVLLVESDSYQTATRVRDLDPGLPADDLDRIEGVTDTIADALDPSWLGSLTSTSRPRRFSPAAFRYQLVEQARAADALVVLPECTEPRTMRAAVACAERGIVRCLLLGARDEVAPQARHLGLRLPGGVTIVDPRAVAPLTELRRPKGWTVEMAREHLADPITVGTMMLRQARSMAWSAARRIPPRPPSVPRCRSWAPGPAAGWCPRSSSCACPTKWSSTGIAPSTPSPAPMTWPS